MKREHTKKLSSWQQSARFRRIGSEAISAWNRNERPKLPKCTAVAKVSGEQCRQPAMKNGKCRFHGGKTPAGADWHRTQWPDRSSADLEAKLHSKLRDLTRAAKKRAARLAKMTPEERKQHELWQRTHKPGQPTARQRARRERKENASLAASVAESPPEPSNEARLLLAEIERLEAMRDRLASWPGGTIFD